jgi:GT2 family glycosyltransferase
VHVSSGANLGFAGGHNSLLGAARGDVVVLLNADAWLADDCVQRAVAVLDADTGCAAVQPKVLRPADGVVDAAGLAVSEDLQAVARGQGEPDDGRFDEPAAVFGVDGAVAVFRRAALDDAAVPGEGPLAATFGSYKEDVELAWRLRRRGWTARYEPTAIAWHERSAREDGGGVMARRRMPPDARRLGWANQRLLLLRVVPLRDLGLRAVGRELASWALLLTRPSDVVPSLRHLARGLRPAWRARRWVLNRT